MSAALLGGGKASPNQVVVCILEARGLRAGDKGGTSDPFVRVRFSGQELRTRTELKCRGTAHWDERVRFVAARNRLTDIDFCVFDRDAMKSDFLGRGVVSASTLSELKRDYIATNVESPRSIWLQLTDKYGTEGDFGELRVVVSWSYQSKLSGKSKLAIYSRLGLRKTTKAENIDVMDDDEADDGEGDFELGEDEQGEDLLLASDAEEDASASGAVRPEDDALSLDDEHEVRKEGAGEASLEKERREEEESRLRAEIEACMNMKIKSGAWRVVFHVIELRELKAEDAQGTSDPVCTIEVRIPQRKPIKRSTSIKKGVRSCVFDEQVFLDLADMDQNTVEAATVKFSVYDADLISRNDLIGSFTFNLIDVYYKSNHRMRNQWIGLIDEQNPKEAGVQGYAKVSINVQGPGDATVLAEDGEAEEEMDTHDGSIGEVLLPPNIQQQLHFLRFRVYQAEDLPALDASIVGGTEGIDAFLQVEFSGNPAAKTRVVTARRKRTAGSTLRTVFNEEIWLPTFNHRLAKNINISLFDRDKSSANDLVGTLLLNFQDVIRGSKRFPEPGRIRPRWYNLYGAPGRAGVFGGSSDRDLMNRNPAFASAYRGRVLLSLWDHVDAVDSERPEAVHKVSIRAIQRAHLPRTADYVLRVWAVAGSEIPKCQKLFGIKTKTTVRLAVSIGPHRMETAEQRPQGGLVRWGEELELPVALPAELLELWADPVMQELVGRLDQFDAIIADLREDIPDVMLRVRSYSHVGSDKNSSFTQNARHQSAGNPLMDQLQDLKLRRDQLQEFILSKLSSAQVPDIFLYLEDKDRKAISFTRFRPEELLLTRFRDQVRWIPLQEDKANNNLDDDDFPGSVQVRLGFGSKELADSSRADWPEDTLKIGGEQLYDVHVHVYQGADLPSADASSLSDPYAYVKLMGQTLKISKRIKTLDPMWYQSVVFSQISLPAAVFAPQVSIDVYDWDKYDADDYLGSARVLLPTNKGQGGQATYKTTGSPGWHPLFQVSRGDCGTAALLVSIDVFPVGPNHPPAPKVPPSITPRCSNRAKLQIVVLGLRGLDSFKGLPIANPRVSFHLGDASKTNKVHSTKNSKWPSGNSPNFGELIEIPFDVPDDLVFLPRLHLTVNDFRLGGLSEPLIGTSTMDLLRYVPTSPSYQPPHSASQSRQRMVSTANPNIDLLNTSQAGAELEAFFEPPLPTPPTNPDQNCTEEEMSGFVHESGSDLESSSSESGEESENVHEGTLLADGATFMEWKNHDPLPMPQYMRGRCTLPHELEHERDFVPPFESFPIYRGQMVRKSFLGRKLKPNLRKVGLLKAVMRVVLVDEHGKDLEPPQDVGVFQPEILDKIMRPTAVQIRVNVLKGFNFIPMDVGGGKSDPYLILRLGSDKINDKKRYIPNAVNPEFYRRFEFQTELPGCSLLKVTAMDYDTFSSDDLIGETVIDLEDRWFSEQWHRILAEKSIEERRRDELTEEELEKGLITPENADASLEGMAVYLRKPVELRSLWTPTSQLEQGKVEMFVDIMDQTTALKYPPLDIAPPEDCVYEMRVIVWKSEDIPSFDLMTKQNDLYVRANFNGAGDKWKYTDTHWRCKNGKGSWNYRLKFKDIRLPMSRLKSRLTLQIWDKDVAKWSDCIAETILDLDAHLKTAFMQRAETYQVFGNSPRPAQGGNGYASMAPVGTRPERVQPKGDQEAAKSPERPPPRTASEISITFDPYTGLPETNAEADDVAFAPPKRSKSKRARRKTTAGPGGDGQKTAVVAGSGTGPPEDDKQEQARELIDTYVPWAPEVFGAASRGPPNSKALELFAMDGGVRRNMGKLYVSVELVRKDLAESTLSNSKGRDEPNRFPKLPKPVGRLKWSMMWNPFYMLRECLGPELCVKFCACFMVTAAILITIFLFPEVQGLISFVSSSGTVGYVLIGLTSALAVGSCCFCAISDRLKRRKEAAELQRAYDLEAQAYARESAVQNGSASTGDGGGEVEMLRL